MYKKKRDNNNRIWFNSTDTNVLLPYIHLQHFQDNRQQARSMNTQVEQNLGWTDPHTLTVI